MNRSACSCGFSSERYGGGEQQQNRDFFARPIKPLHERPPAPSRRRMACLPGATSVRISGPTQFVCPQRRAWRNQKISPYSLCVTQQPSGECRLTRGGNEMKIPAYAIYIAALSLGALLPPGLSAAQFDSPNGPEKPSSDRTAMIQASVFPFQPTQNQSNYILAKTDKSSDQLACEAQCRKAYRRCYSQGNKIGTPEVHGGQPCSEQKVMCLRACPQ